MEVRQCCIKPRFSIRPGRKSERSVLKQCARPYAVFGRHLTFHLGLNSSPMPMGIGLRPSRSNWSASCAPKKPRPNE